MIKHLTTGTFALALTASAAFAQNTPFRDTSMLKPPAGAKVAVVEWEDLECPACAHAAPIVHQAVAQYHIPLVRYDFPLKMHIWSFDAAVYARYLQDKVNPNVATEYRLNVFASQAGINSKDDLQRFTRQFAANHKIQLPFQVDPTGALANEVRAEYSLGERANLQHTPTIVVVTATHYKEIGDVNTIGAEIQNAINSTRTAAPAKTAHR